MWQGIAMPGQSQRSYRSLCLLFKKYIIYFFLSLFLTIPLQQLYYDQIPLPITLSSSLGSFPWVPPNSGTSNSSRLCITSSPHPKSLKQVVQVGEGDPKSGNRIRGIPSSNCWGTHMKAKLHIYYIGMRCLCPALWLVV